jgi:hypothetical protein
MHIIENPPTNYFDVVKADDKPASRIGSKEALKQLILQNIDTGGSLTEEAWIWRKLETTFLEFDTDGDGVLSLVELRNGLRKLDSDLTAAQIEDIVLYMDQGDNGDVDYREFADILGASGEAGDVDGVNTLIQYAIRGTCRNSTDQIIADDVEMLEVLSIADLASAIETTIESSETTASEDTQDGMIEGLELRIPQGSSNEQAGGQNQPVQDDFWSLVEDENAVTYIALRVLTTRQNDEEAKAYCSSLSMRTPSSLGLPRNEKLLERCPVNCQHREGQLYLTTGFLCFEERHNIDSGFDDDSSDEDEGIADTSQLIVVALKDLMFLKKESATMLEFGVTDGSVHLFEQFSKKDVRDTFHTAAVAAAGAFGLKLGESDGFSSEWATLQGVFGLPPAEPLVEDYRCNTSTEDKWEGRLYITPFFACFTEGRGKDRTKVALPFERVLSIETKGAGIQISMESDFDLWGLKLVNFRSAVRDKAVILLEQLHRSAKQVSTVQIPFPSQSFTVLMFTLSTFLTCVGV